MAIQQRFNALQNEFVRLFHTFEVNGSLQNTVSAPVVEIVDQDGVVTLETITATLDRRGVYYVDYFVPIGLDIGQYYDRWTFSLFVGEKDPDTMTLIRRFDEGLTQYFNGNFNKALDIFDEIHTEYPDDQPSQIYIDRCRHNRDNPPDDWDGVYTMTDK